jgi:hypothetical protein
MTQRRVKAPQEINKIRQKEDSYIFNDLRNISKIFTCRISRGAVCRTDTPSNTDIAVVCLLVLQSAGLGPHLMCIGAVISDNGSGRVFTKEQISV